MRTVNAHIILPNFNRKIRERNQSRNPKDMHDRNNLNLKERLELLEGMKLVRTLKLQNKSLENLPSSRSSQFGQLSTTVNAGPSDLNVPSGTASRHGSDNGDDSDINDRDDDFVPSESESESDDELNAAVRQGEENYIVDFPGKPTNFDINGTPPVHPCLLSVLNKLQHSRYKVKWNSYDVHDFLNGFLSTRHKIAKLKHVEMNIIQLEVSKFFGKKIFNVTAVKAVKIEQLVTQFCPMYRNREVTSDSLESRNVSGGTVLHTLKETAKHSVLSSSYPKEFLKIVVCQMTNQEDLQEWLNVSPVTTVIDIPEAGIEHKMFCYPFLNEDTLELECRTLDPSHILNNLRSQICRHGFTGVSTMAFHDVSRVNSKLISKITLADQLDKQKVSVSKDFFCADVEKILLDLGHTSEAGFVQIVRNWYSACDECGVYPLTRLKYLQAMQSHLLGRFEYYTMYPPPTLYIQGITVQTFKAILITVSSQFILYSISDIGHYNHHAISTLGIESFFSELTHMEFSGLGTRKSSNIPKLISHIVQLNQVKHDPDRGFEFTPTKDNVYPYYLMDDVDENAHPYFQNWFDQVRKHKKKEKGSRLGDPFKQDRGVSGIRPNFYRIDESKILMENRCRHPINYSNTVNSI